MPYVKISPPTGPMTVFYSISTPACHDAEAIIPDVPTILFLHPLYIPQQIFQAQFSDHDLRQFNLVTFDMRSHGETHGVIGEGTYTPAEDVFHFMEALNLPPCHIFALSIGCTVAMEFASSHADRVLSLTLCSPQSPTELEELSTARQEVHEEWSEALLLPDPNEEASELSDEEILASVNRHGLFRANHLAGLKQLAFNNEMTDLTMAMMESAIVQAQGHWAGSTEQSQEAYRTAISWPIHRKALTQEELAKINCPVIVIYCTEDVLYSVENAESLKVQLEDAGVEAALHLVPGPHYGCVSSAKEINSIVRQFVLSRHDVDSLLCVPLTAESNGTDMKTPFDERLAKYDYQPSDPSELQCM